MRPVAATSAKEKTCTRIAFTRFSGIGLLNHVSRNRSLQWLMHVVGFTFAAYPALQRSIPVRRRCAEAGLPT